MSAPAATATSASGGTTSAVTVETLLRHAQQLLAQCGIDRTPSWTRRTVRAYLASSFTVPFGEYLMARVELNAQQRARLRAHPDCRRVIAYADPTGETAARNVDAERGW